MELIEKVEEKTIVTLNKNLVASELSEIKETLKKALDDEPDQLAIDLSQVEMIDSMGIGVLIATHNTLQKRGEQLELINVCENIKKLLNTMRLLNHFKID